MCKEKMHLFFDFGLSNANFSKLEKEIEKYEKSLIISERKTAKGLILNVDDVLESPDFTSELLKIATDFDQQFDMLDRILRREAC